MKIDLVYLWVNSDDPQWFAEKKAFYNSRQHQLTRNNSCAGRFRDNDELIYSLRSAAKFAPWINNIHIVTHKQTPAWLNTAHPKIHIVDHSQIIPADAIPNYNSWAIENCINNIPGLSEHYLYCNDDFLFGNYVQPEDFFNVAGNPIHVMRKSHSRKIFLKGGDGLPHWMLKLNIIHTPTPFRKSLVAEIIREHAAEVDATIHMQIRGTETFSRVLFNLYAIAKGRADLVIRPRFPVNWWWRFRRMLGCAPKLYSMENGAGYKKNVSILADIKKYGPLTFCINDGEDTTERELELYQGFFKDMFPDKCAFEK